MKVFICAFGGFYVAIPMSSVASLTDLKDRQVATQAAVVTRDTDTYVSLPLVFSLPQENIRHGIVLKNAEGSDDGNKIVLLSTEVVNTSEIPEENIHPIPRALSGTRFASVFSGIQCDSEATRDAGLVIFLDPERLVRYAQQEAAE